MSGRLYLLHFSEALGDPERPRMSARHYLGYTRDRVADRLAQHAAGQGAAITRAAVARGVQLAVVWTAPGTRTEERRLKNAGHHDRRCPICQIERATKCT